MLQQSKHDRCSRRRPSHSTYRLKRTVIHRLALIASICCVVQFWRSHVLAWSSLEAKHTATAFDDDDGLLERYDNVTAAFGESNRSALIAAAPSWRPLGSGFEGNTSVWNEHVIKTFKAKRSPFRNCLNLGMVDRLEGEQSEHGTCVTRWPTEIPASLITGTMHGFLPVSDAFLTHPSDGQAAQWHLVTPLIQGGTLKTLAKSVSNSQLDNDTTVQTLDVRFRPKFDELLVALQSLHGRGLCHDDIKPENIFVATSDTEEDGAWLIGDLGNVRQVSHPYHSSALWTHSNRQLPDCRANDAIRAIKSYLQFLCRASESSPGSTSNFDKTLFETKQPWARLLWRADEAGNGLSTGDLLQWSAEGERPTNPASPNSATRAAGEWAPASWLLLPFYGWEGFYKKAFATSLKTSAGEGWVRVLALTWVFGVPAGKC